MYYAILYCDSHPPSVIAFSKSPSDIIYMTQLLSVEPLEEVDKHLTINIPDQNISTYKIQHKHLIIGSYIKSWNCDIFISIFFTNREFINFINYF